MIVVPAFLSPIARAHYFLWNWHKAVAIVAVERGRLQLVYYSNLVAVQWAGATVCQADAVITV